jgi:hypothetical protein
MVALHTGHVRPPASCAWGRRRMNRITRLVMAARALATKNTAPMRPSLRKMLVKEHLLSILPFTETSIARKPAARQWSSRIIFNAVVSGALRRTYESDFVPCRCGSAATPSEYFGTSPFSDRALASRWGKSRPEIAAAKEREENEMNQPVTVSSEDNKLSCRSGSTGIPRR